jgi:hypothetical protein
MHLYEAAEAFHASPNPETAKVYETLAISYYTAMIICKDELENILWLVLAFLETKQGPLA